MSKRLQVVLSEQELEEIQRVAAEHKVSVSEWVRGALRRAREVEPTSDPAEKLAAVRAAVRHSFPTGNIEEMLSEIEAGYGGR